MGIGVGILVIRNHDRLKEIQSQHPKGVYSQEEFLSRIHKGDVFFSTKDSDYHGYEPRVLVSTEEHSQGLYRYTAKVHAQTQGGFVADFFWSGDAVFTDKDAMLAYQADLRVHYAELDREAI